MCGCCHLVVKYRKTSASCAIKVNGHLKSARKKAHKGKCRLERWLCGEEHILLFLKLSSIPSTHIRRLTIAWNPSSRGISHLCPLWALAFMCT